jgi:hypothetical protein
LKLGDIIRDWIYAAEPGNTNLAEAPVTQGFSCNGAYLAVVHNADNLVSVYAISGSSLQELSGSPITVATEDFFNVVAACP